MALHPVCGDTRKVSARWPSRRYSITVAANAGRARGPTGCAPHSDQRSATLSHSLLTVIDHVLKDGTPYQELGAAHFDHLDPDKLARYHVRRLAELGYAVQLEACPAA